MSPLRRVVVIGGGIAGLAAAHRLRRIAPDLTLTLLESEGRLGGKILTERAGPFLIEAGPDSFLSHKPWGLALCRELGLEARLQGADPGTRRAYVLWRGRLHPLPEGLTGLIPSRLGPLLRCRLLSPAARARMALEPVVPRRAATGEESLAAFVRRRLGRQAYERLIEPLMAGIVAGDGEALSLPAAFPQLQRLEREHGSLLRGLLAARREGEKGAGAPRAGASGASRWPAFLTLAGGMGDLVAALAARLGAADVKLGTGAAGVRQEGRGLRVETGAGPLPADAVIVATPAFAAAELLSDLDPALAGPLAAIPHASTATVSAAFPASALRRPLDGHGYVVPRAERRPLLATSWTSSKFPGRAPSGFALLRAFLGRAGEETADLPEGDLVGAALAEWREVLGIAAPPVLVRVHRWPRSMPQYTLGHLDRLAAIDQGLARQPGLFLAGNAYRGFGIPDCIRSGEQAAEAAAAFLGAVHRAAAPQGAPERRAAGVD